MSEEKRIVNMEYKDRLLNFIFGIPENKEWTLSLYNAVNHSDYKDPELIEFNTIKEVLYLGMHNDTSFLISDMINVYEHQSSYNPNMPLRQLQYLGNLYESYIVKHKMNKFGSALLELPVPKLVVLYNGTKDTADEVILNLSDSFNEEHKAESDVEVRVHMLNINYGHSKQLLEACKPLEEYAWFVYKIRENKTLFKLEAETAVNRAIDDMPNEFVIKPFLLIHRAEVKGMLLTEYNEEETHELFRLDGKREGIIEGKAEGKIEDRAEISALYNWLNSEGRISEFGDAMNDENILEKLLEEYKESNKKS